MCLRLSFCICVSVSGCRLIKSWSPGAAMTVQILLVPPETQLLTFWPRCSCHFVVTFWDVTSDPVKCWPPAKLSLTCKSGRRGHTLSRADRGRNHGDRGRPPRHTGHLETQRERERKYLFLWWLKNINQQVCVCVFDFHATNWIWRFILKKEKKEEKETAGKGRSNLFTCSLCRLQMTAEKKEKQRVEKDNLYMCLSCSRPQIMCSGRLHTHTQGTALSAFSQSWWRGGLIGCVTGAAVDSHTHTHTHTHMLKGWEGLTACVRAVAEVGHMKAEGTEKGRAHFHRSAPALI